MPATNVRGGQVLDGSVQRVDIDVTTVGQSVCRKIVQGTGITLSSTGADAGTGDVTINASAAGGEFLIMSGGVNSQIIVDQLGNSITSQ
jgi:hypothetical protein